MARQSHAGIQTACTASLDHSSYGQYGGIPSVATALGQEMVQSAQYEISMGYQTDSASGRKKFVKNAEIC